MHVIRSSPVRKAELLHEAVTADLLEDVGAVLLVDERDAAELPDGAVALQVMVPFDALLRIVESVYNSLQADRSWKVQFGLDDREELLKSCALFGVEDFDVSLVGMDFQ